MVRTIYQQLSPAEVHGQLDRVVEQLREPFPQVAELLADAAPDLLAFTAFPVAHWQKLWSNNPQERLNREIRRRRACPRKGTWWASSQTGCRRGVWWARCWPSSMTSGLKPAATSPSPTPPATRALAPNGYRGFEARIYKCGGHQALSHWEGSKKMTMVPTFRSPVARCCVSTTPQQASPSCANTPSVNQRAAGAQYAGRIGLINIKRDDALLHYLTGHYPELASWSSLRMALPSV